MNLERWQSLV